MAGHYIPNTRIAIDIWEEVPERKIHFLTHFHETQLVGLTSEWKSSIYTSTITARYLTNVIKVKPRCVKVLVVNKTYTIIHKESQERFTVAVICAYHCPGSVMFLFEGNFGRILYTGHCRYKPSMLKNPALTHVIANQNLDVMYLDNTYAAPECQFPSDIECLRQIVETIRSNPERKILLAMLDEDEPQVLHCLAKVLKEKILVSKEKYNIAQKLLEGEDRNHFTDDPSQSLIHAVELSSVAIERDKNESVLTILLTLEYQFGGKKIGNAGKSLYVIPYSTHSNHCELVSLVSQLCPKKIVPIVTETSGTYSVIPKQLNDLCRVSSFSTSSEKHLKNVHPNSVLEVVDSTQKSRRMRSPRKKLSLSNTQVRSVNKMVVDERVNTMVVNESVNTMIVDESVNMMVVDGDSSSHMMSVNEIVDSESNSPIRSVTGKIVDESDSYMRSVEGKTINDENNSHTRCANGKFVNSESNCHRKRVNGKVVNSKSSNFIGSVNGKVINDECNSHKKNTGGKVVDETNSNVRSGSKMVVDDDSSHKISVNKIAVDGNSNSRVRNKNVKVCDEDTATINLDSNEVHNSEDDVSLAVKPAVQGENMKKNSACDICSNNLLRVQCTCPTSLIDERCDLGKLQNVNQKSSKSCHDTVSTPSKVHGDLTQLANLVELNGAIEIKEEDIGVFEDDEYSMLTASPDMAEINNSDLSGITVHQCFVDTNKNSLVHCSNVGIQVQIEDLYQPNMHLSSFSKVDCSTQTEELYQTNLNNLHHQVSSEEDVTFLPSIFMLPKELKRKMKFRLCECNFCLAANKIKHSTLFHRQKQCAAAFDRTSCDELKTICSAFVPSKGCSVDGSIASKKVAKCGYKYKTDTPGGNARVCEKSNSSKELTSNCLQLNITSSHVDVTGGSACENEYQESNSDEFVLSSLVPSSNDLIVTNTHSLPGQDREKKTFTEQMSFLDNFALISTHVNRSQIKHPHPNNSNKQNCDGKLSKLRQKNNCESSIAVNIKKCCIPNCSKESTHNLSSQKKRKHCLHSRKLKKDRVLELCSKKCFKVNLVRLKPEQIRGCSYSTTQEMEYGVVQTAVDDLRNSGIKQAKSHSNDDSKVHEGSLHTKKKTKLGPYFNLTQSEQNNLSESEEGIFLTASSGLTQDLKNSDSNETFFSAVGGYVPDTQLNLFTTKNKRDDENQPASNISSNQSNDTSSAESLKTCKSSGKRLKSIKGAHEVRRKINFFKKSVENKILKPKAADDFPSSKVSRPVSKCCVMYSLSEDNSDEIDDVSTVSTKNRNLQKKVKNTVKLTGTVDSSQSKTSNVRINKCSCDMDSLDDSSDKKISETARTDGKMSRRQYKTSYEPNQVCDKNTSYSPDKRNRNSGKHGVTYDWRKSTVNCKDGTKNIEVSSSMKNYGSTKGRTSNGIGESSSSDDCPLLFKRKRNSSKHRETNARSKSIENSKDGTENIEVSSSMKNYCSTKGRTSNGSGESSSSDDCPLLFKRKRNSSKHRETNARSKSIENSKDGMGNTEVSSSSIKKICSIKSRTINGNSESSSSDDCILARGAKKVGCVSFENTCGEHGKCRINTSVSKTRKLDVENSSSSTDVSDTSESDYDDLFLPRLRRFTKLRKVINTRSHKNKMNNSDQFYEI